MVDVPTLSSPNMSNVNQRADKVDFCVITRSHGDSDEFEAADHGDE
jgi:hypothetical protein